MESYILKSSQLEFLTTIRDWVSNVEYKSFPKSTLFAEDSDSDESWRLVRDYVLSELDRIVRAKSYTDDERNLLQNVGNMYIEYHKFYNLTIKK